MNLNNMKIGRRLQLGFGVMQILMLVQAGLALVRMDHIQVNMDQLVDRNNVKVAAANSMLDHARNIALATRDLIIMEDKSAMGPVMAQIAAEKQAYQQELEHLSGLIATQEGQDLLAKVAQARSVAEPLLDQVAALGLANRDQEAYKLLLDSSRPAQIRWLTAMDEMLQFQAKRADKFRLDAHDAYENALLWTIILSGAAMLTGFGVTWLVTRSITRPLQNAITAAAQVAAGDLSTHVAVHGRDEPAQLLQALQDMSGSLAGMVREVRGGSETIASASSEIAAGNLDLSARTEQQADALE